MHKESLLSELNPSQRKAVETTEGPVLIVAGAGSGKTKTLTHRIAHLIEKGIAPSKILAVTFTNKAAAEMRNRVHGLIGNWKLEIGNSFIGTFHSLGAKILREEATFFKRTPHFTIIDEDDALSIVKTIIKELNIDKEKFPPQNILASIDFRKNNPNLEQSEHNFYESLVSKIHTLYEERLATMNAFDFDDLILKPAILLTENEKKLHTYQSRWDYILIDEYQDINPSQYLLIKLLAEKHRNICAVGDDAQSIYSWRGADFGIFLDFERDWSGSQTILLEENYRSSQNILAAANALIVNNVRKKEKRLFTHNEAGPPIYLIEADSDTQEARICIDTILGLTKTQLTHLDDVAILYRTNAQSRVIEEACIAARLPYQMVGGTRFYDRSEIKDILAYLKLAVNPCDTISIERIINVPARGLGKEEANILRIANETERERALSKYRNRAALKTFLEFLTLIQEKAKTVTLVEMLHFLLRELKYQEYLHIKKEEAIRRWENVQELVNAASTYDTLGINRVENLVTFLETANLYQDTDALKETKGGIKLMTIHAAKGLEFETVFVIGFEEGVLPHERNVLEESSLEEERRLAYVALTRAKKSLYLLYTRQRKVFGILKMNPPSRFLGEIPGNLIEYTNATTTQTHIDDDFIEYY